MTNKEMETVKELKEKIAVELIDKGVFRGTLTCLIERVTINQLKNEGLIRDVEINSAGNYSVGNMSEEFADHHRNHINKILSKKAKFEFELAQKLLSEISKSYISYSYETNDLEEKKYFRLWRIKRLITEMETEMDDELYESKGKIIVKNIDVKKIQALGRNPGIQVYW